MNGTLSLWESLGAAQPNLQTKLGRHANNDRTTDDLHTQLPEVSPKAVKDEQAIQQAELDLRARQIELARHANKGRTEDLNTQLHEALQKAVKDAQAIQLPHTHPWGQYNIYPPRTHTIH